MESHRDSPHSRYPDDRSDSGLSSLRSGSGDERCGSRSSALSSTDDVSHLVLSRSNRSPFNRSPLNRAADQPHNRTAEQPHPDAVRVWRDPSLAETQIRHVDSVQHQSLLLMSHQGTPAAGSGPPATSGVPAASMYAPVPQPPSMLSAHPRPLHSHVYAHAHHMPEMLWKAPYLAGGLPLSHQLAAAQGGHHGEEMMERERIMQERHNERFASSIR